MRTLFVVFGALVAALLSSLPVQAQSVPFPWSPPRSSPFAPPESNDRTFVVDDIDILMPLRQQIANGQIVTVAGRVCVQRIEVGPLDIEIPVTRVVGDVNPDGTLVDPKGMVAAGVISRYAKLRLMTWDVDYAIEASESLSLIADSGAEIIAKGILPERDAVSFNGVPIYRSGTTSPFLDGQNNQFVLNEFDVPIELVKFPRQPASGSDPTPAANVVTIEWDVGNIGNYVAHPLHPDPGLDNFWCALIDWAALSFQAMSPVLLIHGNNSDPGFWDRYGFSTALAGAKIPFDGCGRCPNPITLPTTFVAENAMRLDTLLAPTVRSFGADGVHLVAHSKGGLDTRDYLARYQPAHDDQFKVLSFTSLSTPHNGSLLADLKRDAYIEGLIGRKEFVGFPGAIEKTVKELGGEPDKGQQNLTTGFVAAFNAGNLAALPEQTIYNAIAADMDLDGDGMITQVTEYQALLQEESALSRTYDLFSSLPQKIINTIYLVLRHVRSFTITHQFRPSLLGGYRLIAAFTAVQQQPELGNDSLVTIPSGLGQATFETRLTNRHVFDGADGRNHVSVADAGVAVQVYLWLFDIEREYGDLRPLWQPPDEP
jgi:pimeloyl-ACP methyl ester carboxylesterase